MQMCWLGYLNLNMCIELNFLVKQLLVCQNIQKYSPLCKSYDNKFENAFKIVTINNIKN